MARTPDNDGLVEAEVGRRGRSGNRPCRPARWLALLLFLLFGVSGSSLFAQADQYEKKGLNPEHSYQIGDVDAVNVFNGALTINLGVAQRYPVGGSLSYGLNLVYTGPKFVVRERNNCHPVNGCPPDQIDYISEPDPWFKRRYRLDAQSGHDRRGGRATA